RGVSAAQILLAWVISHPGVMAIPKAASVEHVAQNAAALTLTLTAQERSQLDNAFPAPGNKVPLDMV
ncbi:aldo/keto reductase, partial [Klebsiella quasipneumoniae]